MKKRKGKIKMDCRARRNRRMRGRSCNPSCLDIAVEQCNKPWSFMSSCYSFLILSSLIGVIYLMLDYHCSTCSSKCDINHINRSIEDISKNLASMKNSYFDLELKVSRVSQELPKLEGQFEIIEALASALDSKGAAWDPRTSLPLPNVDVCLNKALKLGKNASKCGCPKRLPKILK
ncbi:uncharacterized protein LOC111359687 [Spodoptera litura]|uniref:Uncharacterized protein LOC111359687 n=1 Tax=Spodoptera litura TaxID=69820 RepID=A0A9J7ENB1_SPOLT|nr:uncharacterized protein LOC111359687 [Spodoptera litura]